MNSSRPYLIRAFYQWITDNHLTPYLVVQTDFDNVQVPEQFIEDNRIILNISPGAVRELLLENDHIEFSARFSGVTREIYAPIKAVSAIYAKENGRGMVFKPEDDEDDEPPPSGGEKGGKNGRPKLTVVK